MDALTATVEISDAAPPEVWLSAPNGTGVAEGGGSVLFYVHRDNLGDPSPINVTVGLLASGGVGVSETTGGFDDGSQYVEQLTIGYGQASASFYVYCSDDENVEPTGNFTIALSTNLVAGTPVYVPNTTSRPGSLVGSVYDNDVATVNVEVTDDLAKEDNGGTNTAAFRITRNSSLGALDVYFTLGGSATESDDYTCNASGTGASRYVHFSEGETTASFIISAVDETVRELDEVVSVTLAEDASNYTIGSNQQCAADMLDNDVRLTPGPDQIGSTGDEIVSVLGGAGKRHYVSPRGEGLILLKSTLDAPEGFAGSYYWEGDPNNVTGQGDDMVGILRASTGSYLVQLKRTEDNAVLDEMYVWIVWADMSFTLTPTKHNYAVGNDPDTGVPASVTQWGNNAKVHEQGQWVATKVGFDAQMKATVAPASIFNTTADVPDLRGTLENGDAALEGTDESGDPLSGGVNRLWDMSRRKTVRSGVSSPAGANTAFAGTPLADPNGMNYPADTIIGNDDSGTSDEDNNPYDPAHLGIIKSNDYVKRGGPSVNPFKHGYVGDFYTSKVWFQDFARLKIGATWFNISDNLEWRVEFHYRKRQFQVNTTQGFLDVTEGHTNQDSNGNGNIVATETVGFWDEDPNSGSFAVADNSGLP